MAGINIIQAAETKGSLRHDQPGARFLWSSLPGKGCIQFLFCVFFFLYILPDSFAKSYVWCSVGSNLYWNREAWIQTHTDSEAWASVWCVGSDLPHSRVLLHPDSFRNWKDDFQSGTQCCLFLTVEVMFSPLSVVCWLVGWFVSRILAQRRPH